MGQYDEIYSTSSEEPLTTGQQATSAIAAEVSDFISSIASQKGPKRAKISPLYRSAQLVVANGNEIKRVYDVPITLVPHFGTLSHKLHEEVDRTSLLEVRHPVLSKHFDALKQTSSTTFCAGNDSDIFIVRHHP